MRGKRMFAVILLVVGLLAVGLAATMYAQTQLSDSQVSGPPGGPWVRIFVNGNPTIAQLDASLELVQQTDMSWLLRTVMEPVEPFAGYQRADHVVSGGASSFPLPGEEYTQVLVFRNGVLQQEGSDYTMDAGTIQFASVTLLDDELVSVLYF